MQSTTTTYATSTSASPATPRLDAPTVGVGFWPRAGARLIDTVVGSAFSFVSTTIAVIVATLLGASDFSALSGFHLQTFVPGLFSGVLFHTCCEAIGGASPGKLLLGFRVVDTNGAPVRAGAAFLRNLAYFVDGFFFALPAYSAMESSPLRQRLGDRWAHTLVVTADVAREHGGPSLTRSIVGCAIGTVVVVGVGAVASVTLLV